MAQTAPTRPPKTSNRKQVIILLAIAVFLLLAILVSQTAFNETILRPGTNQQTVVFSALSLLISLLFVALTFVLARNLLKLFAERRLGVLGSKFRTRMVVGALLLSFVPVMVMYWFAYGLMNRSIDKWFSTPVEEVRADTDAMASLLANYAAQNARSEAASIAASPETQRAFEGHGFSAGSRRISQPRAHFAGRICPRARKRNCRGELRSSRALAGVEREAAAGTGRRRPARPFHLGANGVHAGQRPGWERWHDSGGHAAAAGVFADGEPDRSQPAALSSTEPRAQTRASDLYGPALCCSR